MQFSVTSLQSLFFFLLCYNFETCFLCGVSAELLQSLLVFVVTGPSQVSEALGGCSGSSEDICMWALIKHWENGEHIAVLQNVLCGF